MTTTKTEADTPGYHLLVLGLLLVLAGFALAARSGRLAERARVRELEQERGQLENELEHARRRAPREVADAD